MHCASCNITLPPDSRFCASCGQPLPGAPGPAAAASTSNTWLIVVLVAAGALGLVAFAGIVAAIAIPNLLNAIDRGKQKRTMADLRTIANGIEAYSNEHGTYPVAQDLVTLRPLLSPDYVLSLPMRDGWNHQMLVASEETSYLLISPGKDGVLQGCEGGPTASFNDDICFSDGAFMQWPEGLQR